MNLFIDRFLSCLGLKEQCRLLPKKRLFLGFLLVSVLFITAFFFKNVSAASSFDTLYAPFTPVVNVDRQQNIWVAWQDFRPYSSHDLLLQKLNAEGTALWGKNKSLGTPTSAIRFISLDADMNGNIFIAWVTRSSTGNNEYLYLQKLNSQGEALWRDSLLVATMKNVDQNFDTSTLSGVKVDKNGNAYFVWIRTYLSSGKRELVFQLVNSGRYALWTEGKVIANDFGMVIDSQYPVDLELNAQDSVAYITWVDGPQAAKERRINLQKVNYFGEYQWQSPMHIPIDSVTTLVQFPGIELDGNENIFLGYLTSRVDDQHRTTFRLLRLNRFGQTLWESNHTTPIDPGTILTLSGLAVDENAKSYFLLDTMSELIIKAYKPGFDPVQSSTYAQHSHTLLAKQPVQAGAVFQAHTGMLSIEKVNANNIVVAWNQYLASFVRMQDTMVLQNTSNEHVMVQLLRQSLDAATPVIVIDTPSSERIRLATEPTSVVAPSPSPVRDIGLNDSDGDGLTDSDEQQRYHTDALNPDTDGDGYHDGDEIWNHYNPLGICRVKTFVESGPLFAYGKRRLASLSDEQCRAKYIRKQLETLLPARQLPRSAKAWQRITGAFIYGDYPVHDLVQLLQGRKGKVHPSIAWSAWKNTQEYQKIR